MPRFRTNIIANFLGKGWLALMSLAFIPAYIKLMGIEAYGLVGFYISLNAILGFMELGMGTTLNRELARICGREGRDWGAVRDLLRSFEWLIWSGAIVLAVVIWVSVPAIAVGWLKSQALGEQTVAQAIALMGLAIALRLPFAVYGGGLCGLQRQGPFNVILVIGATLRSGGVVLVLWLWSSSIISFFAWHILIECLQSMFAGIYLWRILPRSDHRAVFRWSAIRSVWRFSAGMTLIGVIGALVAQLDKLMVGIWLSLEMLGYYSVVAAVVSGLYYLAYPINTAVFPRFSVLLESGNHSAIADVFHRSSQLMAIVIWPVCAFLVCYGDEILRLWMADTAVVGAGATVLSIMALGVTLNVITLLPGTFIQASGYVWPSLMANGVVLVFLLVWLPYAVQQWALLGAASAVVITNLVTGSLYLYVFGRRLGWATIWRWLSRDNLPAMLVSGGFLFVAQTVLPMPDDRTLGILALVVLLAFSFLLTSMTTKTFWIRLRGFMKRGSVVGEP